MSFKNLLDNTIEEEAGLGTGFDARRIISAQSSLVIAIKELEKIPKPDARIKKLVKALNKAHKDAKF